VPQHRYPLSVISCQLHECQSTASAAFCWFFRRYLVLFRFIGVLFGGWIYIFFCVSAHGTVFHATSATARCGLFHFAGAPGARFGSSTASGCLRTRDMDAADADQPGNTQPGKQLFQILVVHENLLVRMMTKTGLNR
jgi:hypothetical protein